MVIKISHITINIFIPIIIAHINLDRVEQSLNKNINNHENNEHKSEVNYNTHDTREYIRIYSSCNDIKEDGLYYIKPIPN